MQTSHWWERAGLNEAEAERLRYLLRKREQQYRAPHGEGQGTAPERLNRRRYAAEKRRNLLKSFAPPRPRNVPREALIASQSDSSLLKALHPTRDRDWRPIMHRTPKGELAVRDFSMIDHPIDTIRTLEGIAQLECTCAQANVHFDDRFCLDVGAYLLLEAVWRDMGPFFSGGRIIPSIGRVLEEVGLRRAMGWKPFKRDALNDDVFPFIFQRQERPDDAPRSDGIEPPRSAKIASQLGTFIDIALKAINGVRLTNQARRHVKKLASEILDNAETHGTADRRGSYTIAGFIARRDRAGRDPQFRFHLALLSLGQTIAEGLVMPPVRIRREMADYIAQHKRTGLTDENLRTVYALRDGVTRLEEKLTVLNGKPVGGTGLADILEFFAGLSLLAEPDDDPKLAIVSGRTYMRAAKRDLEALYRPIGESQMGEKRTDRELWFNEGNDITRPPDADCVFSLPRPVPGTLVTMAFDLNPRLTEALENADARS